MGLLFSFLLWAVTNSGGGIINGPQPASGGGIINVPAQPASGGGIIN